MLYDRPYMRASSESPNKSASAVTSLLIITIGVYVIQQVLNVSFPGNAGRGSMFLTEWFALNGENFKSLKVWTIFSYAFLHSPSNFWHIIGNMLGLFYIGRILEPLLGKQQFLLLYCGGAVIGGFFYLIFHFNGFVPVVGASAAVSAILAFFCLRFPERQITLLLFFVVPLTVKPKWLFWGYLGFSTFSLLFSELPGTSNIAHSAHLGGFLAGVVFYRYIYNEFSPTNNRFSRPNIELPEWFKRRKSAEPKISYQVNRPSTGKEDLQREVDRILDKINTSGFNSLNKHERALLDRAKEILSK